MEMKGPSSWQPSCAGETPAALGASGRWLTAEDLFATDAEARVALWSASTLPLAFPRHWPEVFKQNATLKAMVNKSMLRGVRCRAVDQPSADDLKDAAGIALRPLHSFDTAMEVADKLGWAVVKGFLVLERANCAAGASFVALRHWWNAKDGVWVDLCPRPWIAGDDTRALLVESPLGEKAAVPLSAASRDFAVALAARLHARASPVAPPAAPEAAAEAAPTLATAASRKLDYAKWDQIDVSDDEDEAAPHPPDPEEARRAAEHAASVQRAEARRAERQAVRSAVDAAAEAAAAGDEETLARLQEGARTAAPLDPSMEAILNTLPQAAQIAARAAAATASVDDRPVPSADGGGGGGEPSLKELLAAAQLGAEEDAADPELEDPHEFVDDVETSAGMEAEREAAVQQAAASEVARARAAKAASMEDRIEWVGEWADGVLSSSNARP